MKGTVRATGAVPIFFFCSVLGIGNEDGDC